MLQKYEIYVTCAILSEIKSYLCDEYVRQLPVCRPCLRLWHGGKTLFRHKMNMKINSVTYEEIHRPIYILEEEKLRRNLQLIRHVATTADVEIILAFKLMPFGKRFLSFVSIFTPRQPAHSTRLCWGFMPLVSLHIRIRLPIPTMKWRKLCVAQVMSRSTLFPSMSVIMSWLDRFSQRFNWVCASIPNIPKWVQTSIILCARYPIWCYC